MPLQVGSVFAGYLLEEEVGRGGMGVVYRARNVITERHVALKVLIPELARDMQFRARFKRESRLAARLEHEHVIPLYHAGEDEGLLYLLMRYVQGTDLRSLLVERGALAPDRAVNVVAQVASALDAAHAEGLIHRDVKPANVLIEGRGDGRAYLTDFGLVKQLSSDSTLTETGVFMGTYHYAAPEQLDSTTFGPVSARTDVYALGCVLYHCLTGEVPYPRDTPGAIVAAHLFHDPPDVRAARPQLPSPLTAVVTRAMAKDPEQRHATAGELAAAALAATTPGPGQPRETPRHRLAPTNAPPPPAAGVQRAQPINAGGGREVTAGRAERVTAEPNQTKRKEAPWEEPESPGKRGGLDASVAEGRGPRRTTAENEVRQARRKRRALFGLLAGIVAVAAAVVIIATGGGTSQPNAKTGTDTGAPTNRDGTGTGTSPGAQPNLPRPLGQIQLKPVGSTNATGVAYIVQSGDSRSLVVQAQVPPLLRTQRAAAYEVWLYNSNRGARSLGAQFTNAQGTYRGTAKLPSDYARFKALDISREPFDNNKAHSGKSLLRGTFASLQAIPQPP